jgi:tetratricopeptide (TPR) repeat protein
MRCKLILIIFICLNSIICASAQKKIENARNNDPQYQYNMGLFYLNEGVVDEAIKYLNRALELNPRYDVALYALGLSHSMNGNLEESIKHLQNCLTINPTLTDAHNALGAIYQEMGLLDQAEKEFRIAISDENYTAKDNSYYNLARIYLAKGNLKEALNHVEMALGVNRRMVMAHNLKGIIYEGLNDFVKAIDSYKIALETLREDAREKDVDINFNLAVAYFKNNEFDKAKEIFIKISARVVEPARKAEIEQYLKLIK